MRLKFVNCLTDFMKGIIIGFVSAVIIISVIAGLIYSHTKNKELLEYAELQMEIETLREDYSSLDPAEFLEVPGVRGAADGAAADFDRKLDEILQRFRNRDID